MCGATPGFPAQSIMSLAYQTGVAIGFFVREKDKLSKCGIHYVKREDAEIAVDKLAYLGKTHLDDIGFEQITPDKRNDWLNQSNSDFERLIPHRQ